MTKDRKLKILIGGFCLTTLTLVLLGRNEIGQQTLSSVDGCTIPLTRTGEAIRAEPDEIQKLHQFRKVIDATLISSNVSWAVGGLEVNRRVTETRAKQIIDELLDPKSPLTKAFSDHVASVGGSKSPVLWDLYLKFYDKVVAFSSDYLRLFLTADKILPKVGRIVDYGAGTGNGSVLLTSLAPGRHMLLIDSSRGGLESASKKLNVLADGDGSRYEIRVMNISKENLPPVSVDGAIMNNVLYALDSKSDVLKGIFNALKPGGTFILNDPADVIKHDPVKLKKFLYDVVGGALENGAPLTEYEAALLAAINIQVLLGSGDLFLSAQALKELAERAGFELKGHFTGYYGASTYLVLQKPKNGSLN